MIIGYNVFSAILSPESLLLKGKDPKGQSNRKF